MLSSRRAAIAVALALFGVAPAAAQQKPVVIAPPADTLAGAFGKLNANDAELYAAVALLRAAVAGKADQAALVDAVAGINRTSLGLGLVDNTRDLDKPVSTATRDHVAAAVGAVSPSSLGLGRVDNTRDLDKPVSTAVRDHVDIGLAGRLPLAGGTMTGRLTLNGSGLPPSFVLNHALTGRATGNASATYLYSKDTAGVPGQGIGLFLNAEHEMGGSAFEGHRGTLQLTSRWVAPSNGVTANPYYVTFAPTMAVSAPDGGSADPALSGKPSYTTGRGAFFTMNPVLKATNAPDIQELAVQENNILCDATCSVAYKAMMTLVPLTGDVTAGSQVDAMISMSSQPGAVGIRDLILIGPQNGATPYNAETSILRAAAGTIKAGLDLSALTITGDAIATPGYRVGGTGLVEAAGLATTAGTIRIGASMTPASASSPCQRGEIAWDQSYTYVCVAADTWRRAALASW